MSSNRVSSAREKRILKQAMQESKDNKAKRTLEHAAPEMLEALKRSAPWLGRAIAENVQKNTILPKDIHRTLDMVFAAIEKAENK